MSLLALEQVVVRRGGRDIVRGVDLRVERGEVVAVLGPNGAGKSTLLEAIGGVVRPAAGRIRREGRVASVLQTPALARRSARANVELGLAWWGVPRSERRARALEALTSMRADHLAQRSADALSGGERRRVHVARGLACRPDLLLLDEPFAGLDPETRAALCEDTATALRSAAGGVIVVVHDRTEAWALADRLVVLVGGRIAADGRPAEVLASPPDAEVARFLGYDGELTEPGGGVLLTRPPHVHLDTRGDLRGTVSRVVPRQDGLELEVRTDRGSVRTLATDLANPLPALGDDVNVRVTGGVRYPAADSAPLG